MLTINVSFKLQNCIDDNYDYNEKLSFKAFKMVLPSGEYINNDDVMVEILKQFNIDAECVDGDCTFTKENYCALLEDVNGNMYTLIIEDIEFTF